MIANLNLNIHRREALALTARAPTSPPWHGADTWERTHSLVPQRWALHLLRELGGVFGPSRLMVHALKPGVFNLASVGRA